MKRLHITVNGEAMECEGGTAILALTGRGDASGEPYVAAVYNNEVAGLGAAATTDGVLDGVTAAEAHGWRVWQRSMGFLLAEAAAKCYPSSGFRLQHSMGTGLVFSFDRPPHEASSATAERLNTKMRHLVEADLPIRSESMAYMEALRHFEAAGQTDKLNLLRHRNSPVLKLYACGDYYDLWQGALVPNTGLLGPFLVIPYEDAFVLHLPAPETAGKGLSTLPPFVPQRHLFGVYREHARW